MSRLLSSAKLAYKRSSLFFPSSPKLNTLSPQFTWSFGYFSHAPYHTSDATKNTFFPPNASSIDRVIESNNDSEVLLYHEQEGIQNHQIELAEEPVKYSGLSENQEEESENQEEEQKFKEVEEEFFKETEVAKKNLIEKSYESNSGEVDGMISKMKDIDTRHIHHLHEHQHQHPHVHMQSESPPTLLTNLPDDLFSLDEPDPPEASWFSLYTTSEYSSEGFPSTNIKKQSPTTSSNVPSSGSSDSPELGKYRDFPAEIEYCSRQLNEEETEYIGVLPEENEDESEVQNLSSSFNTTLVGEDVSESNDIPEETIN